MIHNDLHCDFDIWVRDLGVNFLRLLSYSNDLCWVISKSLQLCKSCKLNTGWMIKTGNAKTVSLSISLRSIKNYWCKSVLNITMCLLHLYIPLEEYFQDSHTMAVEVGVNLWQVHSWNVVQLQKLKWIEFINSYYYTN